MAVRWRDNEMRRRAASPALSIGASLVMKAIVQDTYGSSDVLRLREIPPPDIGDDDVLVRVLAAGVDRATWHLMTGRPYLVRVVGFGLRAPKVPVPGSHVAGRVESVGKNVTRFATGDEVYGTATGAFAEYASARPDKLAPKPANLTFEQAAVVPHSGFAALQALRDHGKVQPGQKVLIIGAAGAVGSFAVQLAKAFGAEVTGVCNGSEVDLVRSLGADHVIDYTRDDFADGNGAHDLIIDTGGNSSLSRLRSALAAQGTLVIVGGEGGGQWFGGVDRQLRAHLLSPFVSHKLGTFVAKENAQDLLVLNELIESGKVAPVIGRTYPLSEAADAFRQLEAGHSRGRIVITL